VRIDGELWSAQSAEALDPGEEVVVRGIDGLVLDVTRHPG
jgi:membrane protein implicated in regulation of membrane protease activity